MRYPSPPHRRHGGMLAGMLAAACASGLSASAASPEVIAVAAVDPYADVRGQLTWLGEQVGNPALAGFAESFVLLATQGKGLAGLDVKRPMGIVVTSEGGPLPSAHAFVPVKDLGKLLAAIQGVTGPVDDASGVRRIAPPGMPPLEIVDRDGWAVMSPPGSGPGIDDPMAVLGPLAKDYSLVIELFPARMPADMRARLEALLDEAARSAAAQGQPMDDAALRAAIGNLDEIEKLVVGLAIDTDREDVHVDVTSVVGAGTPAAAAIREAGNAVSTIASPATADGGPAALRGHYASSVPAEGRAAVRAGIDRALEQAGDDPAMRAVAGLVRELVAAMLDTGGIDAGFTVDTSGADESSPLPAITVGMRIKDGDALQRVVKERLGRPGALPSQVTVAFDSGREGTATLHEVRVDVSGTPAADRLGDRVTLTLAVTPDHAWLLAGGDVRKRLAAAVAAGGRPVAGAAPVAGVDASLAALVAYAARMAGVFANDSQGQAEELAAVAEQAAGMKSTQVRLSVRPVERGATLRLMVDGGALKTIAASTSAGGATPARSAPLVPLQPAQPRRAERDSPAIAP